MKIILDKHQKKELLIFGVAFIFFALAAYSYMNITPCNDMFCFDPRPLLSIVWPIIGTSFLIKYILLLKNKSRPKLGKNKVSYLLILLGIIFIFLIISYKITFTNVGKFTYQVTYPHKFEAFKLLNGKFHICSLEKIDSQFNDDDCYTWWATKFRSEYFCTKAFGINVDNCFRSLASLYSGLAIEENDYSICDRAKSGLEYEHCIIPYIKSTGNLIACDYVKNDFDLYKDCILRYDKINESLCNEINLTKNKCINEFSDDYNDVSYCEKLDSESLKKDCFIRFIERNRPVDCRKYNTGQEFKDLCFFISVGHKGFTDFISCYNIESDRLKNRCLYYSAIGNLNESLCLLINKNITFGDDVVPSASYSVCLESVKYRQKQNLGGIPLDIPKMTTKIKVE